MTCDEVRVASSGLRQLLRGGYGIRLVDSDQRPPLVSGYVGTFSFRYNISNSTLSLWGVLGDTEEIFGLIIREMQKYLYGSIAKCINIA